jgi:hypothetical protein
MQIHLVWSLLDILGAILQLYVHLFKLSHHALHICEAMWEHIDIFLEQIYNLYDDVVIPIVPYNIYLGLILCTNINFIFPQWLMVIYLISCIPSILDDRVAFCFFKPHMPKFLCRVLLYITYKYKIWVVHLWETFNALHHLGY